MGLSSTSEGEETAMAEAWPSLVEKVTGFFSADQIEASARRTKFVQRASKIAGKLFLALAMCAIHLDVPSPSLRYAQGERQNTARVEHSCKSSEVEACCNGYA